MKNDKYDSSQVHLFTSFPETHADDETMEEVNYFFKRMK